MRSKAARQRRLLVPLHERRNANANECPVEQERSLSEHECCPKISEATAKYIGFRT
jgi:hypothetical protein